VRGHADLWQSGDRLRSPRRAGLAVAGEGIDTEDSADIGSAGAFAADEFRDAVEEAAFSEVFGRGGMDGMIVGVKSDLMLAKSFDDIRPAALLQHSGLFADDFESRADLPLAEHFGETLSGIVIGGEEVIFGVEPEDDIDGRRSIVSGAEVRGGDEPEEDEDRETSHDWSDEMKGANLMFAQRGSFVNFGMGRMPIRG